MEPLLQVRNLNKSYRRGRKSTVAAVCDMSFDLFPGQCLGLVGESGCGKSSLCRLITGLERPDSGQILFHQQPLDRKTSRGKIQMVFQNSLDAVSLHMDAFHIISEPMENFFHMSRMERRREAARLMELVGLSAADLGKYPRQFSGGQLQRVCIARALAAKPELLVLDEPLSSLDVSVQAQILNLLADLKQELGLTCILISHDLEAVYYLSDAILVMYGGSRMEQMDDIRDFLSLCHPYTRRLLEAHGMDADVGTVPEMVGHLFAGGLPGQGDYSAADDSSEQIGRLSAVSRESFGCPYAPRCAGASELCFETKPPARTAAPGHIISCHQMP